MRKIKIFAFVTLVFLLACQNAQKRTQKVNRLILEIKNKYVPDSRVDVFDVKLKVSNGKLILSGKTNIAGAKDELIKAVSDITSDFVDSVEVLPSSELGDKIYGVVTVSVANMRSEPSHRAELVNQLIMGTEVQLLEKKGGWYLVKSPDPYIGWLNGSSIARFDENGLKSWKNAPKVIFTDYFGLVRSKASLNSEPVCDLVLGAVLKKVKTAGFWVEVELPNGKKGFVKSDKLKDYNTWLKTRKPTVDNIIKTAKKFIGFPYLWGGTSVRGFDCSGFTKTVFKMNGVKLPRDASQQALVGVEVDPGKNFENLKPGDLLFFGKPGKIVHVGIYIGNGEFIHCSGEVKINSLNPEAPNYSDYRRKTFVKAKRMLK